MHQDRNRRSSSSSDDSSLDGTLSVHEQHVDHDVLPVLYNSVSDTIEPRNGPDISITSPGCMSTVRTVPGSFHMGGAHPSRKTSNETPQAPLHSLGIPTWRHDADRARRRSRSESPPRALKSCQRSLSPRDASRRTCMFMSSNFDNVLGSYHANATPRTLVGDPDEPATKDYQERSDTAVKQHAPYSMHRNQNIQNESVTVSKDVRPIGKWRCCECLRGHDIYRFETGEHLINILNCQCKHRSCKSCTFQGDIRRFAPIDDTGGVASIPLPGGYGKAIQFGVICHTCGLSWRAERVQTPKRHVSLRQRLSILPRKANPLHQLRHTRSMVHLGLMRDTNHEMSRPGTAMSTSRSIFNLRSASDSQAKSAGAADQAPGVEVRFYGIECTCETITDASSVCFQIINTCEVEGSVESKNQGDYGVTETSKPHMTPELQAKGYGTPTLYLKGGSHPNPLRSNPL